MDLLELMDQRHSVRVYRDRKIEPEKVAAIREEVARVNAVSGLHIQLVEDAAGVFSGLASKVAGWRKPPAAYLALVGRESDPDVEEKCGYYGEELVLFLQSLGLNTCWVGMFNKKAVKAEVGPGERTVITVAVGYGETSGSPRRSKPVEKVTDVTDMPDWFRRGVECALKAPTAINQQKFFITLEGDAPVIRAVGKGPFIKVDLGIVKYHFEVGARH